MREDLESTHRVLSTSQVIMNINAAASANCAKFQGAPGATVLTSESAGHLCSGSHEQFPHDPAFHTVGPATGCRGPLWLGRILWLEPLPVLRGGVGLSWTAVYPR